MMYNNKMAFAIKVSGKVLREHGESVFLPFGSEYSLFIKNLNNRRACVKLTIDGQDVVDGGLVVNANSSIDLERFVKSGQMDKGNRFKFIARNAKVESARGIGVEDGLLRIEFEYEKEKPVHIYHPPIIHHYPSYPVYRGFYFGDSAGTQGQFYGSVSGSGISSAQYSTHSVLMGEMKTNGVNLAQNAAVMNSAGAMSQNIAGITVSGSVSEQKFVSVHFDGDGQTQVMILRLFGETETAPVQVPVTVKTKQKCITCNHMNKATSSFCCECGTSLTIV